MEWVSFHMNEAIKYAFFIVVDRAMMDPMMVTVRAKSILHYYPRNESFL